MLKIPIHRGIPLMLMLMLFSDLPGGTLLARAQHGHAPSADRKTETRLSFTPIHQFSGGLDGGGNFSVSRYLFDAGITRTIRPGLRLGVGINYQYEDYDFSARTAFGQAAPWDTVHRLGFGVPIVYRPVPDWTVFASPSFQFSAESGADWADAFIYGGIASASYAVAKNLVIGPGLGVFKRFDEVKVFPFVAVYWKITDRIRLSNPFHAGPAGPAGLEGVYAPDQAWEFGVGGAYRSFRFRLDDTGVAPRGSGQTRLFPVFGRVSYRLGPAFRLDFHAGCVLGGELTVDDADGNKLASEAHDPAAFLSLTIGGTF